jgi:iron complex outermembrane receptor protein
LEYILHSQRTVQKPAWKHIFTLGTTILIEIISLQCLAAEPLEQQIEPAMLSNLSLEELSTIEVITIATRREQSVTEAPAIGTVITAQEIETMGATTLVEALEGVPGLHAATSGDTYTPRYIIRGISTTYTPETLIMINGIPIPSVFREEQSGKLGFLPVKMISKIEVIRGPGSALYGADAFAGVINIVTKTPMEIPGTELGGRIGSFDSQEAWLFHSETGEELKALIMADYQNTAGQTRLITEDAQTRFDNIFGARASLAPGPVNLSGKWTTLLAELEKGKWKLRGSYFGASNLGTGQGFVQALDPVGRRSRSRTLLDLTYHDPKIAESLDFTSQLSYHHESQEIDKDQVLYPPGVNLGTGVFPNGAIGNPEYWERQFRFENSILYTGLKDHRARAGVGYFYGSLYRVQESKNFTPNFTPLPDLVDVTDTALVYNSETSRYDIYGFLQDEWNFSENWELTLGARYDNYSDFGGTFNPRAALVWQITPKLTGKLLYGRAFRAPYFAELYIKNNPNVIGNPNLKPETINVYEIGWDFQANQNWELKLNLFHYDAADLIDLVRNPAGTGTFQNSGTESGNGFEFETKWKAMRNMTLTTTYSFVNTSLEPGGGPAGNYPKHMAYFRTDWGFLPNWSLENQIFFVGQQDRVASDPRSPLKSYTTVDLTLRRNAIFRKLNAALSLRNIFDADVREPSPGPGPNATTAAIPNDLPQEGRNVYGELSVRF